LWSVNFLAAGGESFFQPNFNLLFYMFRNGFLIMITDDELKYKYLNSQNSGLFEFPSEWSKMTGKLKKEFEEIVLSDNYLYKFPKEVFDFDELKYLYLDNNYIEEIPSDIDTLKNLSHLFLSENRIESIPSTISNLKHLSYIDLSNNFIKEIPPSIGEMENVINLNLEGNPITELPANVCERWKNDGIDINADASYEELCHRPESELRKLDYSSKSLSEFQNDVRNFSEKEKSLVKSLDLSYRDIGGIPDEVFELSNLEGLLIQRNYIKTLANSLDGLENLTYLDVRDNEIEDISATFGNLKNLVTLRLSRNKIKKIPSSIGKLKKLRDLEILDTEIEHIPNFIGELKNLRGLYLYGTNIKKLPSNLCKRWKDNLIQIETKSSYDELCGQ
jgi:Leucine-rich repeat (LRR) protein